MHGDYNEYLHADIATASLSFPKSIFATLNSRVLMHTCRYGDFHSFSRLVERAQSSILISSGMNESQSWEKKAFISC